MAKPRFGLQIAAWYAFVFVVTSLAIVWLTYALLARTLELRDKQIVGATLKEYSERYAVGGLPALADAVHIEQRSGLHGRLFVRVVRGPFETLMLSAPSGVDDFDISRLRGLDLEQLVSESGTALEVASGRLPDGTLLQVGKSSEEREALLAQFRALFAIIALVVLGIGLAGGVIVTRSAQQPINRLISAVRNITRTGKIEDRVPVRAHHDADAIDQLSALFNEMLNRISTLMRGREQALDNVAHDLRTPMTRLRGVAERALQSDDPRAIREALVTSLEESERILAMLTSLMDISEAETGAMRLERSAVDVSGIVSDVIELYSDVAEDKHVTLSSAVDPGLLVHADPQRLRQVIANLVDNAVKYTPNHGRVTVSARSEDATVRIEVADTGAGIHAHDLPHIWDRLYRGDQSRAERGLGLGLSMVRAIVAAHGGTTAVTSEPGKGSTFTVTLPAQ